MTEVLGHEGSSRDVQVIIGVDTHQDQHVAVALDRQGVRLDECHVPATTYGYAELEWWARSLGEIRAFGIEGTGSYGAGALASWQTGTIRSLKSIDPIGQFVAVRERVIPPMRRWQRAQCSRA